MKPNDDVWPNIIVEDCSSSQPLGRSLASSNSTDIKGNGEIHLEPSSSTPPAGKIGKLTPYQGSSILRKRRSTNSIDLEPGSKHRVDHLASSFDALQEAGLYNTTSSQKYVAAEPLTSTAESAYQQEDTQSCHRSLRSTLPEDNGSLIEPDIAPDELFRAFPKRRWLRPLVLAVVGFCIMTLMVLGNLIYT
jgi:hypothetical protein